MKKIIYSFAFLVILTLVFLPHILNSDINISQSYYSNKKIFIKTNIDLPISEATGEVSLTTGFHSFDVLISKYKVKHISRVFPINSKTDIEVYNKLEMSRIYKIEFDNEGINIEGMIKDYSQDKITEYSEPVFYGFSAGEKLSGSDPNDKYFSSQWYLKNNGNIKPSSGGSAKKNEDINMIKAWEVEEGSEDVIIAILDSGLEDLSPDLAGRTWTNKNEIPANGRDDDGNGYIDDVHGWDFAYTSNNISDGFGHGTNIASVIGANKNDNFGFAGINSKSKLMICKNLSNNNTGEYEWWAESIRYAVDNGAKIINMSEGGEDFSRVLKSAVDYAVMKDVFISASMMNRGDGNNYYPAAYPGVFAVGATDSDGRRCRKFSWGGGSCYGKHISVVAPGNKIYGVDYEDVNKFDTYWSGTSQATAIVSGLASLLLSQDKRRTADEIKSIIKLTAIDQIGYNNEDTKGFDIFYGWGRIDCFAALTFNDEQKRTEINNKIQEKNENKINENYDDGKKRESNPQKPEPRKRENEKRDNSTKTQPAKSR